MNKDTSGSSLNEEIIEKEVEKNIIKIQSGSKADAFELGFKTALSLKEEENNELDYWKDRYDKLLSSLQEKIEDELNKMVKQAKEHIEQFGKGKNREIDSREKAIILTMPMVMKTKISKIFKEMGQ